MKTLAAALLVLALAACSSDGGDDGSAASDSGGATSEAPETPEAPEAPEAPDEQPFVDLSTTEACAEVRAGIDAFNLGDLEETVERFEAAVPLAEGLVVDDPESGADLLLEAIRYYATLPTEEYAEASPSPDFQKYKAITLTACAYGAAPGAPSESETIEA